MCISAPMSLASHKGERTVSTSLDESFSLSAEQQLSFSTPRNIRSAAFDGDLQHGEGIRHCRLAIVDFWQTVTFWWSRIAAGPSPMRPLISHYFHLELNPSSAAVFRASPDASPLQR